MDDGSGVATCLRCAAPAGADARFCSQCGAPLAAEPPVETDAERRNITVLFADLSGFTSMTARHDPEDVRALVDEFLGLARVAVDRWGGRVDQFLGDGLMAIFGDPVTREDDAERAVRAAIEIRDGTTSLQHGFDTTVGTLESHLGVATGMAVTADATNSLGVTAPLGTAVNLAARLQSLATSGEVLVCSTTAARVATSIETTSIGAHELKGLDRPTVVHRVDGVRRAAGDRHLTALVGREREVEMLTNVVEALVRDRSGTAVMVVAEAGAGKTRLVREVRRGAASRHGAGLAWYEGRGSSLGAASPYLPVVEIIRAMAHVDEHDDGEAIRDRLRTLVTQLGLDGDDVLGPLLRLVGHPDRGEAELDRESYQVRLARAVEALLRSAAATTPVVICVQDLHWVDPSTISLLRAVVPSLRDRVFFLFNSRPVDTPVFAGIVDEMRLRDLAAGDVAAIIASRLGGSASRELADLVYERAGGNAFFAEEVLNRLVDEDAVVPTDDGWALRNGAGHGDVPDTVQGVIAARLDLLPLEVRTRLRHAAVYGREFTVDDLLGIDPDHDPRPSLAELERADLVRADADRSRYEFKHALTLDVARAALTKPERRRLHLAAAVSIEQRMADRVSELGAVIGMHYSEAGQVEPAVRYLGAAAELALDRYAIDEADQLYGSAYRLLVDGAAPAERSANLGPLLVRWVLVHYYRGTWRQATDLLAEHDREVTASNDPRVLGMALAWRGFSAAIARAAIADALDLLDRAIEVGERADDAEVLAHAHTWRIWARFLSGDHTGALADGQRVDALLDRLVDRRYAAIKSAGAVGLAQIGLGYFDAARRTAAWLIDTGATTGSTRATAMGESVLSLAATLSDDAVGGAHHGRRAVDAATDPIYRDMARLIAVYGLVAAGEIEDARAMHADLLESCTALSLDGLILAAASAHAVIRVFDGDLTAGMRELDAAIEGAERAGSQFLTSLGRVYRAGVRSRSVTREVAVPLGVVLRNPGFVARHALPARRSAVDDLERLIAQLDRHGGAGLRWLASIELAKLLVARNEPERAELVLDRARGWMPDLVDGSPARPIG